MYSETLEKLINNALAKTNLYNTSFSKYLMASLLAGAYVGLAIFLIMIVGSITKISGAGHYRIFMGLSFGMALSLVVMAGSELFTGTNLVMIASTLSKKTSILDLIKIWGTSYLGNLIGAILIGTLFVLSQSGAGDVGDFMVSYSEMKISLTPTAIFFKGVLCNIFVCLATLCYIRLKEEGAKLIMIFWCLFAFITSGYEHSIANMSLFTVSYLLSGGNEVSLVGISYNLFWSTFGNIVGGSSLGAAYYFIGKE